jgi:hypothetical protein
MDSRALAAARTRLARAKNAVAGLDKATTVEEMHSGWWAFLLAADGIYSKLEQGAKGTSKSEPWFGKVKHLRKTDPLLLYIHQARNSDEHGIEDSSFTAVGTTSIHPDVTITEGPNNTVNIKVAKMIPKGTPLASGSRLTFESGRGFPGT